RNRKMIGLPEDAPTVSISTAVPSTGKARSGTGDVAAVGSASVIHHAAMSTAHAAGSFADWSTPAGLLAEIGVEKIGQSRKPLRRIRNVRRPIRGSRSPGDSISISVEVISEDFGLGDILTPRRAGSPVLSPAYCRGRARRLQK